MKHHFYIASIRTWVTAEDLTSAFIKFCENTADDETPIIIAKIPLSISESYEISWFVPKVENLELIYLCDKYFDTANTDLSLSHQEMLGQLDWAMGVKHYES